VASHGEWLLLSKAYAPDGTTPARPGGPAIDARMSARGSITVRAENRPWVSYEEPREEATAACSAQGGSMPVDNPSGGKVPLPRALVGQ
jgi:hypothetical protein